MLGRRLLRKAPTHRQVTAAVGLLDGISGDAGPASSPSTWWARTVCRNRRFPSAGRGAGVWLVRGAHVRCRAQLGDDLAHLRLDRRTHGRAGCRGGSAAMPDGPAPGVAARDPRPGLRDLASHLEPHGRKRPAARAWRRRDGYARPRGWRGQDPAPPGCGRSASWSAAAHWERPWGQTGRTCTSAPEVLPPSSRRTG